MGVTSDIPIKYLNALIYFAAMYIAEQTEQFDSKKRFEMEGYKKLALTNAREDVLPNSKRAVSMGYFG